MMIKNYIGNTKIKLTLLRAKYKLYKYQQPNSEPIKVV